MVEVVVTVEIVEDEAVDDDVASVLADEVITTVDDVEDDESVTSRSSDSSFDVPVMVVFGLVVRRNSLLSIAFEVIVVGDSIRVVVAVEGS